jgi:ligand-binding sensor domain-containing protein
LENGRLTKLAEATACRAARARALRDADGSLWIGSYDGGLARFKDGKFTRYDTKTGLPNDGAFQILEDDNRHFWIHRIAEFTASNRRINEFADGRRAGVNAMPTANPTECSTPNATADARPRGTKTRDGRLWFPTQDGVAVIDPENIKTNSQPPPVVIETVKIDNELSEPSSAPGALNAA